MRMAKGCGWVTLFLMFAIVACLIFVSLAAGLFLTGELPVYGPRLTGLEPHPNYAFLPSTPITLTFDQPMNTASVEGALVLEPDVAGTFRWNQDLSQVAFTPEGAGFEPGTTYSVRLESGAKAGTFPRTTTRSVEWSFSLPPLLDELEPAPGAEGVGPKPVLQAAFNYHLDCTATFRTFSISPDTAGLLGCKDSILTFEPAHSLQTGTSYVAVLAHVFLRGDPTPRPGAQWDFRTPPPLVVEEVLPQQAGSLDDLWSSFTMTFSRPVEPESAVSRFSLRTTEGVSVDGDFSWQQDGAVLIFQPEEPLMPAMEYELVVAGGVQDVLGYELEESWRGSYATPPMMGLPVPVSGSRAVALDSTIRVPFARPMDKESVEAGLVLTPSLEGEMVWEEDTLVFTPLGGFSPETEYQVLVRADIRDASGAPLAESRQWTFTTEPFLVKALVPSDEPVTQLQQPLEFAFALPMDRASVRAALTISPTTLGDLMWSDTGRTVTFVPSPAWLAGADYEVSLAGSMRTADGLQTLGDEVAYAFTTGLADVRFGQGTNVQVVATDGERVFQVLVQGADVADFRMNAITLAQFLDLYGSESSGTAAQSPELLVSAIVTPTESWREPLSLLDGQTGGEWQLAEAHIPAETLPGLYVLSAEPPSELQGQLLVVLSDHVLVVKKALAGAGSRAEAQIVAWDTAISDGSPVVSATMRLYDDDGAVVAEGATDGDGLLVLNVPRDPGLSLVVSEKEGDITVAGLEPEWSEVDGMPAATPESRPDYLIYTFTDQTTYRPSGTVHFKQFVRADDDVRYTLPAPDLPIAVRLRDVRDNVAASQVLTTTEFGTAYGTFEITDRPMFGLWTIETEVDGALTRTPIHVVEPQGTHADDAGHLLRNAELIRLQDTSGLPLWQAASRSEQPDLSVEVDPQTLDAGQVAQIMISTPVSGTALLSLERGTVHYLETVALVSGTNQISVAVQPEYAPNVEVVVSQFWPFDGEYGRTETQSDPELHTARAQLLVPMVDRLLTVSLGSDQEAYGPGDEALVHLLVKDHQDEPVVAEISLALVDEATYAQSEESIPNFLDVLYGPQPNSVRTYVSMRPARSLTGDELRSESLPLVDEGEAGGVPPGAFLDTAFWAPAVVTDAQGAAEVTLQVPDGLAKWMVVARAVTTDTLVGGVTMQLVVTQEISIRPEVPAILVQGDAFSVTAEVHNHTTHPVSATIQLEQNGLKIRMDGSQTLHVPAGGTATALWPAVAEQVGESQITMRATATRGTRLAGRDVAQVSLRINPLALAESATWSGALTPDNPVETVSLTIPADPAMTLSRLQLSMAPSAAPALLEGLAYLAEYPYDCVEQTVGRIVAGAIAANTRDLMARYALLEEADLPPTVQLGLQTLYSYQHDDGGWSWWHTGSSDAYQTAYVLQGLAITAQAGFAVDQGVRERGVEALRNMLTDADPEVQAYGAYALVMAGHPVTLTLSVTDVLQLDAFSQAALAIAIDVAAEGDLVPEPALDLGPVLLERLENAAIEEGSTAYWAEEGEGVDSAPAAMGSLVRTTALVTQALVRLDPESDLLPKAVRWLMGQREGQAWGDTQKTSHAILALAEYVRSIEPEAPPTDYQVLLNEVLWAEGQIDPLQGQEVLTIPVSALGRGDNELQVRFGPEGVGSSGLLYYTVTATSEVAPSEGEFVAVQGTESSIGVRRAYRLQGSEEPATEFEPGDLVEVLITLDVPEDSWYVVIEDPLPSGFEIAEAWQQATGSVRGQSAESESKGTGPDYDRMDVSDGRVAVFFERLRSGSQSFSYLVRAVTRGNFTVLPATVYPMYHPEAQSRSASSRCVVKAR